MSDADQDKLKAWLGDNEAVLFADATLNFLREKIPRDWHSFRDSVTNNFRIIKPTDFRFMA